jgi:hypothetical protein
MASKIAGFVLTKGATDYLPEVNKNLNVKTIKGEWGNLYLYSTDSDIVPVREGVWSLGFPAHQNLLHHNLLLSVEKDSVLVENDWIGGIPVYFNQKKKIVSTYPEVCQGKNPRFDDEGMYLFMKYGFSAFGTTPFEDVSTLRYYSALRFEADKIVVTEKEDPALSVDLSRPAGEDEIWELIREDISHVMNETSGVVVSPLSGGLDSRIINALIPEEHKSRVRTFSYGISPVQKRSFEPRIANEISEKLGLKWEQIFLKDAFRYMDQWHDLFGFGMHLHGMMHIEFYKKILGKIDLNEPPLMFSGISGSAFQGGHPPKGYVTKPSDLYDLALTHGLNSNSWLPYRETEAETRFFEQNKALLAELKWYPVLTMRIKMNLLHYLYKLPDNMGISSTSPYHNFEIASKMLSLPDHRRNNRQWVNDFFKEKGLYIGNRTLYGDTRNTINRQLFLNHHFDPVDEKLLTDSPVPKQIIRRVNRKLKNIGTFRERLNAFFTTQRVIKEILKMTGIKNILNNNLSAYLLIKAVEKSVRKYSNTDQKL